MTTTHLVALLRDIDNDIETCRRHIAELQVEIARLQDTRLTLLRREERKAYFAGQPSPFGDLNGAQIAVRDPELRLLEEGVLSRAAKTGAPIPALAASDGLQGASWWQHQQAVAKKPHRLKRRPQGNPSPLRHRLLVLLKDVPEGLTSIEVSNYLGVPAADEARKPIQNCLYNMRQAGLLEIKAGIPGIAGRKDAKAYFLTELGQQAAARLA
jgi:hypothetical protein